MKISIITVNYNDKIGLQKTITSVVNQAYKEIEFIIIDGGSTDGSNEVIKRNEKNISYWVSEKDKGIYNAMNKGVAKATGDYLFFLNSGDDFYDENVLAVFAKEKFREEVVYGNVMLRAGKDELITYPKELSAHFFFQGTIIHQGVFFRKKCFDVCNGYDENLKIVSDWKVLLLSLCRYNLSFKYFNHTVSNFYADGLSSNPDNTERLKSERKTVLEEEFPLFVNDYEHYTKLKYLENKIGYIKEPMKIYYKIKNVFKK